MARIVRQLLDFARRRTGERRDADLVALARHDRRAARAARDAARRRPSSSRAAPRDGARAGSTRPAPAGRHQPGRQRDPGDAARRSRRGPRRAREVAPPPARDVPRGPVQRGHRGRGRRRRHRRRDLPAIFDPFFTTKPSARAPGSGSSVAYGHRRASTAAGSTCDSELGAGSVLPRIRPAAEEPMTDRILDRRRRAARWASCSRSALRGAASRSAVAERRGRALARLDGGAAATWSSPTCSMQGADGLELCERLRRADRPDVPVVVITALRQPRDRGRGDPRRRATTS